MNGWMKGLLALLLMGMTAGCITTQEQLRAQQDLEEMKRRLATIERRMVTRGQEQSQQLEERLDNLARQQADLQAGLDTLRVEFQSIHGRLNDMGQERAQLREDLSLMQDELGLKLAALEDRIATLEQKAAAPPETAPKAESPQALYEQGLAAIQQEEAFEKGRRMMEEFLQRFAGHGLAPNALYWIGEAYYGEKKFEEAILQFQEVIQEFENHPKVAAALLKQGMAFRALGDPQNARILLQKAIDTYPNSQEAEKARQLLKEWGAS